MGDIKLVVQCDDFGMSHSQNLGAVEAFREGILTQASLMVPCPWFEEAARLAREHSLPVGVHLTLTSEWDYYRWGPISGGRTLVGDDGRFPKSIEAVREQASEQEMLDELIAQTERREDRLSGRPHLSARAGQALDRESLRRRFRRDPVEDR